MKVDIRNTTPHFWTATLWCALGAVAFGAIAVISCWFRRCRSSFRKKRKKNVRRAQSVAEFESTSSQKASITAVTNKRLLFRGRSASSEQDNSESEHSEKSPLVSAKLDSLAKFLFSKSILQDTGNNTAKDSESPTRHNVRYQYTALDSGIGAPDRNPRERAARDRALTACQEWLQSSGGRYEVIAHLDDIGSRHNKHWFLLNDTTIRTDRLMTLIPIPSDCVAFEELPTLECPKGIIMELLGSLQHPYIYPVLDLGFLHTGTHHYACLVMPFNPRGSLKDLIYKAQWNESWNRKYLRKSTCLPMSQVQRLGRQILEALLFLRERGIPSHGHLHSGNVILQNGVARLSGLENGLLGLNSRVNAVIWSRAVTDIDSNDVICFGHLLFEMCAGYELTAPQPTPGHLELDLERYPQVVEVLQMIFDSPDGRYPTLEELVLCDLFRNIDLREMRGTAVPSFKHGLSNSTLSLLQAVRRRQGASINGSLSEGSSPCTPPSTPRDRRTGDLDTSDISSNESDGALDEIIITSDFIAAHYDPMNSPIHFCDNSIQSDDNNAIINLNKADGDARVATLSTSQITITAEKCSNKNSKSRRMEYSMRGLKLGVSNPSQDSAFGSMTDGELSIASSSFRLNSFQSISSPIDEGVEDLISPTNDSTTSNFQKHCSGNNNNHNNNNKTLRVDTTKYSPCHETLIQQNDINEVYHDNSKSNSPLKPSLSPKKQKQQQRFHQYENEHHLTALHTTCNKSEPSILLEPPTLLVNDQRSIYTSSPSKKCNTIEVFSQKYRVSSFEDMSLTKQNSKLINVSKRTFRSFEEEKRIDTAFKPNNNSNYNIEKCSNNELNRCNVNNNEKFKKLTHAAFAAKIPTTKEKHILWKTSILSSRKNNLIKSNESLDVPDVSRSFSRGNSSNDLASYGSQDVDGFNLLSNSVINVNRRKSRSERHLFNLTKFKQSPSIDGSNIDCFSETDCFLDNKPLTPGLPSKTFSLWKDDNDDYCNNMNSMFISPTKGDVIKFVGDDEPDTGGKEENTPLLEGMEMSPLTPPEPEEML